MWVWKLLSSIKEEYTLRVFENRMPRKIFGPKSEELTGDRKKLRIDTLHHLRSPPNNIPAIKGTKKRDGGAFGTYRKDMRRDALQSFDGET